MAYDGIAKVQHYVPRFLLRNFGTGKKDKVHVFDKLTEKVFFPNVKNIAAESRFYDFEIEGQELTIPGSRWWKTSPSQSLNRYSTRTR